ncbi:MAG: histidine phosphatase family protein [Acidobacteriota bacterium]
MKALAWTILALAASSVGMAQTLAGDALVKALQQGGYVILMRHAASPRTAPDKAAANPDNTKLERQLDAEGRESATALGKALRALKIPLGEVVSSPTYRALETVKYAQFPKAVEAPELGDNGQSMQGGTAAQAEWLKKRVTQMPKGTNTVLITHSPNLTGAFPQLAVGVADGEAMIFGPGTTLVARVKIDEWQKLVK